MKNNQLLKNIFSLGSVQLVNYVFPLITVPYVSRIIGPDSYGIINYATAFIAYFTLLIGYGFDLTGTRKIARNPDDNHYVSTVFSQILNARILLFFVSCLLFVLIQHKEDYIILPTLNVVLGLLSSVFLLVYACKKFNLKFRWVKLKNSFRLLLDEKVIFISTVVISLYTTTNTVVLGFFASAADVGFFTVSISLLNVINSVISVPFSTAFFPFIGNAFGKSRETGLEVIRKIFPIISYLTFFAGLTLYIFAPFIIELFYGSQFHKAILSFRIMAFAPFVISMSNVFGIQTMLNLNMDKTFFRATATASILGLLLNIAMSKFYGYIGTAWNTIIIETFVSAYMYFLLRRNNIEVFEKKYFSPKFVLTFLKSASSRSNKFDK